jgi:GNAT superfamily N-acetyltransferase
LAPVIAIHADGVAILMVFSGCSATGCPGAGTVPELRNYLVHETLKDGTQVTVRAVRPDDGPRIRRAFEGLERETIYTRFFGYKQEVTDAELGHITGVDFRRDVALLVTIDSGDEEIVIGGASYFAVPSDSPDRSAELAFTVEEDYQGLGMAGLLMRHLIGIARRNGLARLEADVLARNLSMLAVFRRHGLAMTLRQEGDVVHVTFDLRATTE